MTALVIVAVAGSGGCCTTTGVETLEHRDRLDGTWTDNGSVRALEGFFFAPLLSEGSTLTYLTTSAGPRALLVLQVPPDLHGTVRLADLSAKICLCDEGWIPDGEGNCSNYPDLVAAKCMPPTGEANVDRNSITCEGVVCAQDIVVRFSFAVADETQGFAGDAEYLLRQELVQRPCQCDALFCDE